LCEADPERLRRMPLGAIAFSPVTSATSPYDGCGNNPVPPVARVDEGELLSAVHPFGEAWARNDVAVLEAMLRADYLHTDVAGSTQDRAPLIEYIVEQNLQHSGLRQ
jgi:hypothetical protein